MKLYYFLRDSILFPHNTKRRKVARYIKHLLVSGIMNEPGNKHEEHPLEDGNLMLRKTDLTIFPSNDSNEVLSDYQKIVLPRVSNPKVSIIIPVYNQFDFTYNCIKSILCNEIVEKSYEIILADDCSTDFTKDIEKVIKNLRIIHNEKNLKFLLNCNNAAKYAKGEYICFLNNDTQVQKNWLSSMIQLLEKDSEIGIVGSKMVYPNGRLQEAGGIIWKDGSGCNYGNGDSIDEPQYNYVKETDYISGASIVIRKKIWVELNGFDERYVPAYCEDSDLAFSVRQLGYKVVYQPKSIVVHFEGVSNGTDVSKGVKSYQIVNTNKFLDKWKDVLEKQHFESCQDMFLARDRSKYRKCILVIDHDIPQFDQDAGSRTIYEYLLTLVNLGFNVKFLSDKYNVVEPYTTILEQEGIEVLTGKYYYSSWKDYLYANQKYLDAVFISRPSVAQKYIDIISKLGLRIVYNVCDLHFLREKRQYEITNNLQNLKNAEELKKLESYIFSQSDCILTLSEYEKSIINNLAPYKKCVIAPINIFKHFDKFYPDLNNNRQDIMFVGGFKHIPNVDAVKWFVKEIFPLILKEIPNVKFKIVGSNPPPEVLDLASKNIIITGFVTDEELKKLYKTTRVCVIPLRFGAGIKGKTIEAMYNKIPIVTTHVGIEGLRDIDGVMNSYDEARLFAAEVVKMYNDVNYRNECIKSCYEYIYEYFSYDKAVEFFKDVFGECYRN